MVEPRLKRLPAIWETWVRSLGSIPGLRRSPGERNFAFSGHHVVLTAAILLELDFLSLCLETRALRNTYLDHL